MDSPGTRRRYATDVSEEQCRKGSKVHIAVDILGRLPGRQVKSPHEQDRPQVGGWIRAFPRRWAVERTFRFATRSSPFAPLRKTSGNGPPSPGTRKRQATDVNDEAWAFAAPYLTRREEETLQSTPESGARRGYDALRHRMPLPGTPFDEQDRAQVGVLAEQVQQVTGENVEWVWADKRYTASTAAEAANHQGIRLEVVQLSTARNGFVLLPRR
ncbi:MAG TPA: hypothetical protein VFQ91_29060 [Bryobacteraceae bacterium]|nr:hypothetical protein [Bryobacteraceae bacterium]